MTMVSSTDLMNRTYRHQRHFYDFTRKYYLLGRDRLIAHLAPHTGDAVLEIGCGTGCNLTTAAVRYPDARMYGIDVSTEMLTSRRPRVANPHSPRRRHPPRFCTFAAAKADEDARRAAEAKAADSRRRSQSHRGRASRSR